MNLIQFLKSDDRKAEVIRFAIVGGICTVLQYGIYVVFAVAVGLAVTVSTLISYAISFVANYFLSSFFTFHSKPNARNTLGFAASHLINMGMQTGLVAVFNLLVGKTLALLPTLAICVPLNYFMVRFAFKGKLSEKQTPNQALNAKRQTLNAMKKKVAFASDHAGYELKKHLIELMQSKGYETVDFGTNSTESCDYTDYAHPCATAVENGECDFGIAMCGTGNGIAITLNKHQGIRAALSWMPEIAALAKQHNNANILVLPARFISQEEADKIVEAYLNAEFEGGRHQRRINKIPVH